VTVDRAQGHCRQLGEYRTADQDLLPRSLPSPSIHTTPYRVTLRPYGSQQTHLSVPHMKHQRIRSSRAKQVCSHRPRHLSQPRHRLGPRQGDRQRKQQNGPVNQGGDTHQERKTRQVHELRWGENSTNFLIPMANCSPHERISGKHKSFRERQQRLPKKINRISK